MTLRQFRSNPALVEFARNLFASSYFQQLMEAVRNEHPKNYRPNTSRGMTEQDHSIALGRIYGFDEFDNTMMLAAMPEVQPGMPIVATFAAEQEAEELTPQPKK